MADSPPPVPEPQERRLSLCGSLTIGLVGLLIGGLLAAVVVHGRPGSAGTAELQVDIQHATLNPTASNAVESVAQKLGPATGTVIALQKNSSTGLGSGFVIAHDGPGISYLITNSHVAAGTQNLHVIMPTGHNFSADLVGQDTLDDIAVLRVSDGSLPLATFGSSSSLIVGQPVIAIGSPLGNDGSITSGVVSALHRTISANGQSSSESETLQDVLQTDASINPGNSGGPLADINGNVIGVNVAIDSTASNIGYSIPSDLVRRVSEELITGKHIGHAFLGIAYNTNIEATEIGKGFDGPGVLVSAVHSGTPADKAGFKVGDVLQSVDGVSIDRGQTLGGLIQQHNVGETVSFGGKRGGQTLTLSATLVDRPGS